MGVGDGSIIGEVIGSGVGVGSIIGTVIGAVMGLFSTEVKAKVVLICNTSSAPIKKKIRLKNSAFDFMRGKYIRLSV